MYYLFRMMIPLIISVLLIKLMSCVVSFLVSLQDPFRSSQVCCIRVTCRAGISRRLFFFFKQKKAYERRISDWSSDVGSSELVDQRHLADIGARREIGEEDGLSTDRLLHHHRALADDIDVIAFFALGDDRLAGANALDLGGLQYFGKIVGHKPRAEHLEKPPLGRSEEHTSELQSLMRISYAVFCSKKKNYIQ